MLLNVACSKVAWVFYKLCLPYPHLHFKVSFLCLVKEKFWSFQDLPYSYMLEALEKFNNALKPIVCVWNYLGIPKLTPATWHFSRNKPEVRFTSGRPFRNGCPGSAKTPVNDFRSKDRKSPRSDKEISSSGFSSDFKTHRAKLCQDFSSRWGFLNSY